MPRALVLAAGRGERLRPLTDATPKPLLPVLGASVLERTLRQLAGAGVEATAVNLHHLGEQIAAELGDEVDGMPLTYSPEEDLLGTLGPLARLRSFLAGADPVLLVNGDSLCSWPVEAVVQEHRAGGAAATLLISSTADYEMFGGGVSVDERGRVLSFRGEAPRGTVRRGVFAGLHVISPEILVDVVEEPSDIVRDLYEPLLAAGSAIRAVPHDGRWHDLGTPRRYLNGLLDEADEIGGSWRHPEAVVSQSAAIGRCVLEAATRVEADAEISDSVLLPGARAGAGSRIIDSIIGPGVEVADWVKVESMMLTAGSPRGTAVGGPAVGGLAVATPLSRGTL